VNVITHPLHSRAGRPRFVSRPLQGFLTSQRCPDWLCAPMGIGGLFPEIGGPGGEADHSHSLSVQI